MNGTTRFLGGIAEADKGETRNACNQAGYESVALIPIRAAGRIMGLLHLADPRENMVPLKRVAFLEQVAAALGVGVKRALAEEELRREREWFHVTLRSIGDAVIATDGEGRITFLNPRCPGAHRLGGGGVLRKACGPYLPDHKRGNPRARRGYRGPGAHGRVRRHPGQQYGPHYPDRGRRYLSRTARHPYGTTSETSRAWSLYSTT